MKPIQRYAQYAADFEKSYADDDWSRLERHFAADAVYEVRNSLFDCRLEGRPAVFAGLKQLFDRFDRLLPRRRMVVSGYMEFGNRVAFDWTSTYSLDSLPPLVLQGHSTLHFEGDEIVELVEEYPDGMNLEIEIWMGRYLPGATVPAWKEAADRNVRVPHDLPLAEPGWAGFPAADEPRINMR